MNRQEERRPFLVICMVFVIVIAFIIALMSVFNKTALSQALTAIIDAAPAELACFGVLLTCYTLGRYIANCYYRGVALIELDESATSDLEEELFEDQSRVASSRNIPEQKVEENRSSPLSARSAPATLSENKEQKEALTSVLIAGDLALTASPPKRQAQRQLSHSAPVTPTSAMNGLFSSRQLSERNNVEQQGDEDLEQNRPGFTQNL